ncbi:putative trichothecene 3-O-acetyltransferase [Aspergillus steynii IBT 23096]|uniref:Putative trichothecene 3-O-acetyltransferase n=1 Tax=Aspergillus steynii IBT 23096 TaxID=1392250 RepID=A0A2I2FZC7_9EURO|nr:putative trichothecene 3-O-acetyltransferase [Aspergillus steynii IBT 23096]PLB45990.1 putative trichothecene 3-O-acetyltransferase [Aspergillus steynii IBT 23096]
MSSTTNDTSLTDFPLDIFGQIPALKSYTNISSIYSVPDASTKSSIVDTLTHGLERLAASFPWVAGRVVVEDSAEDNTGVCKIKPFEKTPRFVVKDYRDDASTLSMNSLRDARFPLGMLDESILAPISTLPAETEFLDGRPVFMVQATFIAGGLILTFSGEHRSMDITGQNQIIHLLSKACANDPFSPDELSVGNMPRSNIIPLLNDPDSHLPTSQPPHPPASEPSPPIPNATWACINFPSSSLTSLKSLANESLLTPYISTDDALSAFIWQSVLRARLPRLAPSTSSTLLRAIDLRPFLDISPLYPGVLMTVTPSTAPLRQLTTHHQPLGHTASSLRESIHPSNLAATALAFATHLHRTPDKSRVPFAPNLNPSANLMFSSWSKIGLYGLDFHLGLGAPEAVRRPRLFPVEGLVYAMPRDREGGIAVQVCLRDEDLLRLWGDGGVGQYAMYIG